MSQRTRRPPPSRPRAPAPAADAAPERVAAPERDAAPFWRTKRLEDMTPTEWESLCDGCGKCCLLKLEDEDTGAVYMTDVACRMLDCDSGLCRDYPNRQRHVPDCISLSPEQIPKLRWMPATCAYRLLWEGHDLPPWHHLVCGDPDAVFRAGISVRGRVLSEDDVPEWELEDRIVDWAE